jgi:F-type H+-transporting ATPase subunit a
LTESAHHGPLDQFLVSPIFNLPTIAGVNTSITNSALFMMLSVVAAILFFVITFRKREIVPSRAQSMAEVVYEFVNQIVEENAGEKGLKYFPFMFTLFLFILFANLIGLIPTAFAPTSQIIVTFALGAFTFLVIMLVAIVKQGPVGFIKHFVPAGLPLWMAPVIFVIELVSYLARPLTLAIRLAANITAGHILIHVIAAFVFAMGIFGFLPLAFILFMTGFEIFVAILQAYVFTMLCSVYLGEALADHH